MGAFLDKPRTAKTNLSGEGNNLRFALSYMQGWRVDMEDAHVAQYAMGTEGHYKDWSFFAVFDGHAGNIAADGAAQQIMDTLKQTAQFIEVADKLKETGGELTPPLIKTLKDGIQEGFLHLDTLIREKLDKDRDRSGSTAVCAIITPQHIIIANLGDSRAVVARKNKEPFGTIDHKPYHDKERERIVGAGGSVMIQRINGSLAVSRAFGDFEYKNCPGMKPTQQLVSPEPEVYVLDRSRDIDEYLVLACDGIYDVMENDELCTFVHSRLQVHSDLEQVCNEVLDACLWKGSRDNMTMIVVCFENAPKVDPSKKAAEDKWKEEVRKAVIEAVDEEVEKQEKAGAHPDDEMSVEYIYRQAAGKSEAAATGYDHLRRRIVEEVLNEKKIVHD